MTETIHLTKTMERAKLPLEVSPLQDDNSQKTSLQDNRDLIICQIKDLICWAKNNF